MDKKTIKENYQKETGKLSFRLPHDKIPSYTEDYIEWLHEQLCKNSIVQPKMKSMEDCEHSVMSDPDDDVDEFQRCAECDGHDACADFGCAIKLGLGHLIRTPY